MARLTDDAAEAACHASMQGEMWAASDGPSAETDPASSPSSTPWLEPGDRVVEAVELEPDTMVRLVRCFVHREKRADKLLLSQEHILAFDFLIAKYPECVAIKDLPLENLEQKVINFDKLHAQMLNLSFLDFIFITCDLWLPLNSLTRLSKNKSFLNNRIV
ncbi:unnamed protein product [Protopolystoma xenopodis]|uniref:Uncharacterized protein n=1 Tax=Protopolystoma xenopodis TaxID=117903 RepID=A0A3S5AX24_9PLAT|nr:unnamed protein product [Protopolystoma xenopodis]